MAALGAYRDFLLDLDVALSRIARNAGTAASCPSGCHGCCEPLSVLPVEALAILQHRGASDSREPASDPPVNSCAFLTADSACGIYDVRPFICRVRGFPILHLSGEGEWERESCARRPPALVAEGMTCEDACLLLEKWNVRLWRINAEFCNAHRVSARRIRLADLSRSPARYLGLFEFMDVPAAQEPAQVPASR